MASFSFVVPSTASNVVRNAASRAVSLRPWSDIGVPGMPGRVSFEVCSCTTCSTKPTLGWCATRQAILVSVGGADTVVCRVAGVPADAVSRLVSGLRDAEASGEPVSLVAHGSWSPARFFCGFIPLT